MISGATLDGEYNREEEEREEGDQNRTACSLETDRMHL